jgi:methyl halide transferase
MENNPKINLDLNYWESRYQDNSTGWDLGKVSEPLKVYFDQLKDKKIKILIPGGGNSYEAEYLTNQGFKNVYVVDLSKTALMNLKHRMSEFPSAHLIHSDFFDLEMKFDLIIEQTFFCAIHPSLRTKYAQKMFELLKRDGKLVGLLFDAPLYQDHPPFGGNKNEYKKCFKPFFKIEKMESCYNSEPERKGKELFIKFLKK